MHRIKKNGIELLYEVVGKGTAMLSVRKPGESLDVLGPLGNGFDIVSAKTAIIVAGGIGVAPLLALAEEWGKWQGTRVKGKLIVLIGARKKEHILCEKEFKKIGANVLIATENDSRGRKGFVTDLLEDVLAPCPLPLATMIYACGPSGMLRAVARIAKANRIPCQISLEERMACGVGVCLGCPVKVTGGGYKMVCKDGPVFDAKEIAW